MFRLEEAPSPGGNVVVNWNTRTGCQFRIAFAFSTKDDWQGIDANNPPRLELLCPAFDCEYNHSTEAFYDVRIFAGPLTQFDDGTGHANFNGKVNRFGNVVDPNCTPGPDCTRLILENVPLGEASFSRRAAPAFLPYEDFDLSPPGEFWIEYPN